MEQSLDKLIELAREVGGEAFPMLVERVWAGAFVQVWQTLLGAAAMTAAGILCKRAIAAFAEGRKHMPDFPILSPHSDRGFHIAIVASVLGVAGLIMFANGMEAIPVLMAPEGEALLRLRG